MNSTGHHQCGGTLIAPDIVLSAAHCKPIIDRGGYVQLGRYEYDSETMKRNKNGGETAIETFQVRKQILHPGFYKFQKKRLLRYDFLLLVLNDSSSYQPIVTNHDENIPLLSSAQGDKARVYGEQATRTSLHVMGWGQTNLTLPHGSTILQEAEVKYVPNEQCESSFGYIGKLFGTYEGLIFEDHICAIDDEEDACYGDSGGPLIIKNEDTGTVEDSQRDILVGIVSWGFACVHNSFPGVYGRVSNVYDWIRDNICASSRNTQDYFDCNVGEESPSISPSRQLSAVPSPKPFCSTDKECLPNGICTQQDQIKMCKKFDSQACFFDNECLSNKCVKGLCRSKGKDRGLKIGMTCNKNDQCLTKKCSSTQKVCVEDEVANDTQNKKKAKKPKRKKGV